jgi:hypothetical protein
MKVELLPDIIALERCQLDEIKTIAYTHISQAEFLSVELLFTNNNNGGTSSRTWCPVGVDFRCSKRNR